MGEKPPSIAKMGIREAHDEEKEPMHGMYGTREAELEVQRAIKRAELTAFLCLFSKVIGPTW